MNSARSIEAVRASRPDFLFLAEVYWDLEGRLQQDGFDYCYDKRLYDLLCGGQARPLQEHLSAGLNYQGRLARFLENHDEPRAAAMFPLPLHRAAAIDRCFQRRQAHLPDRFFSPAVIGNGNQFSGGGSGQVAKAVKAQGGLKAKLKSSRILPSFAGFAFRKRPAP